MAIAKTAKPSLILLYLPVMHDGYLQLFHRHPKATIGILDADILQSFDYLRKDIRALAPQTGLRIMKGLGREATLIKANDLPGLNQKYSHIILPQDDLSRQLSQLYSLKKVSFEPIFLRWDRDNVRTNQVVTPDETIDANDPAFNNIATIVQTEAQKSTNWWRRVAAAVIGENGGIEAIAHNQPLITEYSLWIDGDPRMTSKRGNDIDVSVDMHAEAHLVALAARQGVSLKGKRMFVTTFPCPACAKLMALSGIGTCYFIEGYAMLDGQTVLQDAGVRIIKVRTDILAADPRELKPYPAS